MFVYVLSWLSNSLPIKTVSRSTEKRDPTFPCEIPLPRDDPRNSWYNYGFGTKVFKTKLTRLGPGPVTTTLEGPQWLYQKGEIGRNLSGHLEQFSPKDRGDVSKTKWSRPYPGLLNVRLLRVPCNYDNQVLGVNGAGPLWRWQGWENFYEHLNSYQFL